MFEDRGLVAILAAVCVVIPVAIALFCVILGQIADFETRLTKLQESHADTRSLIDNDLEARLARLERPVNTREALERHLTQQGLLNRTNRVNGGDVQ